MKLRENEMNRSMTQALYKYLPNSWIDFYLKKSRIAYTAKVRNWNSDEFSDEKINKQRIIEQIRLNLMSFEENGGRLSGFGNEIDEKHIQIRTPKAGVNADIIAEISPLTFFCSKCMKIERMMSSENISKRSSMLSKCCKKPLKQIRMIYSCECGWAGPVESIPCVDKKHGFEYIKFTGKFSYICASCNREFQIRKKCPSCG
jgi:hypothetical protein